MTQEISKEQIEKIQRETIRAMLDMLSCEYSDFYYNQPNDYGTISLTLFSGEGDPGKLYRGEEHTAQYRDGIRGTGSYKLNDAAVEMLLKKVNKED
jgi:hypothetical protein